jgi:phage terminase large subunit GpA-like protein
MPVSEGDTVMVDLWLEEKEARLLEAAAAGIAPPGDCSVSEWAEASVYLSHRVTGRPGELRLEPYQKQPLDAIKKRQRVVLIWATQTGKTIVLQCFLGWCIDQYPGPAMVVCPDRSFAARRSHKHLRPFIEDSPVLAGHLPGGRHDLQVHEYTLDTMSVTVAWAGSPSQMAGEPIMILGRDEFDKYRDATEKESNAFRLVGRRTASFGRQCRILDCTTPTVENADGWRALLGGTYHRLYVPCPHCATASEPFAGDERNQGWQILTIEQFRYPLRGKNGDEAEELCDWQTRIRKETVYVCRDCGQPIAEAKRWRMVCHGQWVPTNPEAEYDSYHLPSWYARTPTNSFGEVAARYVEGQEDPEAARDWFNADAAEPYRDIGHNAKEELVRHHCSDDYELGTVPTSRPCLLVATSDLHNLVHYCAVWAFTPERTYLIDCLKVETCEAIGALAGKTYPTLDGQELVVEAVFPDAQYRTSEVYELAVRNPAVIPTTGSARGGVISWTKASHYPSTDRELDRVIDVLNTNGRRQELARLPDPRVAATRPEPLFRQRQVRPRRPLRSHPELARTRRRQQPGQTATAVTPGARSVWTETGGVVSELGIDDG